MIYIRLRVEFQGQCYDSQVSDLRHRLDQLWIADVVDEKVKA